MGKSIPWGRSNNQCLLVHNPYDGYTPSFGLEMTVEHGKGKSSSSIPAFLNRVAMQASALAKSEVTAGLTRILKLNHPPVLRGTISRVGQGKRELPWRNLSTRAAGPTFDALSTRERMKGRYMDHRYSPRHRDRLTSLIRSDIRATYDKA